MKTNLTKPYAYRIVLSRLTVGVRVDGDDETLRKEHERERAGRRPGEYRRGVKGARRRHATGC